MGLLALALLAGLCTSEAAPGPRTKVVSRLPTGPARVPLMNAERTAAAGHPRLAVAAYREALEVDPNHRRAQLGLLKAAAASKICGDADAMFGLLDGLVRQNKLAYVARADCAAHDGDLEAALDYYAGAIELDPYAASPRYERALLLSKMGRLEEAAEERRDLFGAERGPAYALLAEAEELWLIGDPELHAVLRQVQSYRFLEEVRRGLQRFESQLALREGCAEQHALALALVNPELAAQTAECRRRRGEVESAAAAVERVNLRVHLEAPTLAPIRVRMLVDQGDLDAAERLLAGQPLQLATVLASHWYLARARGDEAAAAHWAARYAAHPLARRERLEALVPSSPTAE